MVKPAQSHAPVRLTLAEYKAIEALSKARKAKRIQKLADNASLAAVVSGNPPSLPVSASSGAMPEKRSKSRGGHLCAKLKPINRRERQKRLKKAGLVLWSIVVRKRDGNRCIMCGKTEYLQAHHWLFRKSHSVRLALDPDNGATLCYGCHIGRVHHDGDGDFILRLAEKMTEKVTPAKVAEMRETARHSGPISPEETEAAVNALRGMEKA